MAIIQARIAKQLGTHPEGVAEHTFFGLEDRMHPEQMGQSLKLKRPGKAARQEQTD